MKRSIVLSAKPGTVGAGRPVPPVNYRRDRVRDLRRLPVRENSGVEVLDYQRTIPNTKSGPCRTVAHGAVRMDGSVYALCIARDGGAVYLETERRGFNEQAARREKGIWTPQLAADVFCALECRDKATQALVAGRGERL